jgi:hypothetical protein
MTRIRMGLVPGLLLALALAVTACGRGDGKSNGVASLGDGKATATTSPGGSSDPKQGALAFGRCMRQQGINIADPKPGGGIHIDGVNPDDPTFKAAEQACKQYLPDPGKQPSGGDSK